MKRRTRKREKGGKCKRKGSMRENKKKIEIKRVK
jgi:hypothetical protein